MVMVNFSMALSASPINHLNHFSLARSNSLIHMKNILVFYDGGIQFVFRVAEFIEYIAYGCHSETENMEETL